MKSPDPYTSQLWAVLPRLLALYDMDETSVTFGQGDRYRWAWKLIDFGNGTFQGAAHGLGRLLVHDLLPEGLSRESVLRRINAMFRGAAALIRRNGSLEEALPFESSFCVTALVAFDLLSAIELLQDIHLSEQQKGDYLEIVRPMVHFLQRADETHAFISNHLATAAAALIKWTSLAGGTGEQRGKEILDRILSAQSEEGWFREYEGADPGYQTLCTYYLADIYRQRPDLNLLEPLKKSIRFLWHFAHPDGSFGGLYGSRNTRFYYPAGIEQLSLEIPEAASLSAFMRQSIERRTVVTLETMDEPNLVPMFNAYCLAAASLKERSVNENPGEVILPALSPTPWRRLFPDAGLLVDRGKDHYSVISWHKGGVIYHFGRNGTWINAGVVAWDRRGRFFSSQSYQARNEFSCEGDEAIISVPLVRMHRQLPSPSQFIFLRMLCLTVMRLDQVAHWTKKALVRLLITGNKPSRAINIRRIRFGEQCSVSDDWLEQGGLERVPITSAFTAIHMASQGYWQSQDDAS